MKLAKKNLFLVLCAVYLVAALIGFWFLTKSWLPPGFALTGHDSGLPLDSKAFLLSRLYAWDDRIGFGIDNSPLFGSLTLHFVDFVSSLIAGVTFSGNWFNALFWLYLIFLAAFVFAYQLKDVLGKNLVFIFPPILVFNFYILQSLFILERAKYSILVATILVLSILIRFQQRKISLLPASLLAAVSLFLFNGGSLLALPLYGSLLIITAVVILFNLSLSLKRREFKNLFHILYFFLLTGLATVALNAYSIVPYIPGALSKDYFSYLDNSVVTRSLDWVNYISQGGSYFNIFRLQGVPSWYATAFNPETGHPYASLYLQNPILIILSSVFPLLAISSLLLLKNLEQKRIILLFFAIALVSLFFSAGTHSPFGFVYAYLYEHLPGFAIFRTPYYKFSGAFFLSFGFLIAFSSSVLIETLSARAGDFIQSVKRRKTVVGVIGFSFSLMFVSFWILYHHQALKPGNVFVWREGFSTRAQVPEYTAEFSDWLNSSDMGSSDKRILLTPPIDEGDFADGYDWGYWSLSPITYSLVSHPVLTNELSLTAEERSWVNILYKAIKEKDDSLVEKILERLNVGLVLHRADVLDSRLANLYEESLDSLNAVKKVKTFGDWQVYQVVGKSSKISAFSVFDLLPVGGTYLSREFDLENHSILSDPSYSRALGEFIDREVEVYRCGSCLLEEVSDNSGLPSSKTLPNSPFYFYKKLQEKALIENAQDLDSLTLIYLGLVLKRVSEARSMLFLNIDDQYITSVLKEASQYSEKVEFLLQENASFTTDYSKARQVLDVIGPAQKNLQEYAGSYELTTKGENLRSELRSLLWGLDKIVDFFGPMLIEDDLLRRTKVYPPISSEGSLYVDKETFPADASGGVLLPGKIEYRNEITGEIIRAELEGTFGDWVKIIPEQQVKGTSRLLMDFDLPDLYSFQGQKMESFPTGDRGCQIGEVKNFRQGHFYEVNVRAAKASQDLNLYFLEESYPESTNKDFLNPLTDSRVYPILESEPYRYIYRPPGNIEKSFVLVCTANTDFPEIEQMSVYELTAPILVSLVDHNRQTMAVPKVTYDKISPVHYEIEVEGSQEAFLLLFNERFSPNWSLKNEDSKKEVGVHFVVDGYANGWMVDGGNSRWILKYKPQKLFLLGSAITILVLVVTLGILSSRRKRERKR